MNFGDWYTDSMDIWRIEDYTDGGLTISKRVQVGSEIPCRIYQTGDTPPSMKRQAAETTTVMKIACNNGTDVRSGDEIYVTRGKLLGHSTDKIRCFAGDIHPFYEPYGAVAPQLEHTEITCEQLERL